MFTPKPFVGDTSCPHHDVERQGSSWEVFCNPESMVGNSRVDEQACGLVRVSDGEIVPIGTSLWGQSLNSTTKGSQLWFQTQWGGPEEPSAEDRGRN